MLINVPEVKRTFAPQSNLQKPTFSKYGLICME